MQTKKSKKSMDAVLLGSIEWDQARAAAFDLTRKLGGEVAELKSLLQMQDAYSPIAWMSICRQLQVVTDGMTVMRLLAEGKTSEQITQETGIFPGSIAAYKAWNTMYSRSVSQSAERRITLRGRNEAEQRRDADFLRSCGISLDLVPTANGEQG